MRRQPWRSQLLDAIQSAEVTHRELQIDDAARIDVFGAADRLGLWVVFQPLGGLLGALVPAGDGGILITTQRGQGTQRFTCAHEIGHWRLEHRAVALDDERNILHAYDRGREQAAQVFASYFLMPPRLVFTCLDRYSLSARTLDPSALYRVARDMGSSYEATARHLTSLGVIDRDQRERLLRTRPAQAKSTLAAGLTPRTDVWTLDLASGERHAQAYTRDYLAITVPDNPTTGYAWTLGTAREAQPASPPPLALGPAPALKPLPDPPKVVRAHVAETAQKLRRTPARPPATRPSSAQVAVAAEAYLPAGVDLDQARRPSAARQARAARQQDGARLPVGAAGRRLLVVELRAAGNWLLPLTYTNPFDSESRFYQVDVTVSVVDREPGRYDLAPQAPSR